jgi:hypothetical protein
MKSLYVGGDRLISTQKEKKRTKKHSVYQYPYREDVFQNEKVSLFCPLIQKVKKDIYMYRKRKRTKKHSVYQHPYREDVFQSEKVSLFLSPYSESEKGQKSTLYTNTLIEKT